MSTNNTNTNTNNSNSSSTSLKAIDLRLLNYSFPLLFDQPETRALFKLYLTRIKRVNILLFVLRADEYILLKSNVNRYKVALEIVNTFIEPLPQDMTIMSQLSIDNHTTTTATTSSNTTTGNSMLLDMHSEWKTQFMSDFSQCNEESCPKNLFEELYEQKMIELQYDCFRRFTKSDMFFQFMERALKQNGVDECIARYVSKSSPSLSSLLPSASSSLHSTSHTRRAVYNSFYNDEEEEEQEIDEAFQLLQFSHRQQHEQHLSSSQPIMNSNVEQLVSQSITSTLALCFHREILMEQEYKKQQQAVNGIKTISLPWHQFGVSSIKQIKELVRKLIHPRFGIPKHKFIIGTKDRLLSAFSRANTTKKIVKRLMNRRLVFSGEALVTYMCLHFGIDNTNAHNRVKMIKLANMLLEKNIIGPADSLSQILQGNLAAAATAQELHDYCLRTNCSLLNRVSASASSSPNHSGTTTSSSSFSSFKDSVKHNYMFIFKKKLIVIGGGMGGAVAARDLSDLFDVTVIDKKQKLEFMFGMCRLVGDASKVSNYQLDIKETITKKSRYVQGRVAHVTDQVVAYYDVNDSSKIRIVPFDYLIVASGSSYARPFPILSTDRNNATIIYPYSSQCILDHLPRLKEAKSVAVIGGGPVAVEFVSEVCTYTPSSVQITLVSQCDLLLERLCSSAHEDTFKELSKFPNLKFLFNRRVTRVAGDMIECCFNGEPSSDSSKAMIEIQADVIFCCVGNKPNTECFNRFMSDSLTDRGYIKVHTSTLQVLRSEMMATKKSSLMPASTTTTTTELVPSTFNDTPRSTATSSSLKENSSLDTRSSLSTKNSLVPPSALASDLLSDEDTLSDSSSSSSSYDDVEVAENVKALFTSEAGAAFGVLGSNSNSTDDVLLQNEVVLETKEHYENIYALGDVADTKEEKMAYVARNQGYALVRILEQVESGEPITPYTPLKHKTQMISIGPNSAIAIKGNKVVARGYVCSKMKTYVEHNIVKDMKMNRKRLK